MPVLCKKGASFIPDIIFLFFISLFWFNVLTWLGLRLLCMIFFYLCSYSDFFSSSLLNYRFPYCIQHYTWSNQQVIVAQHMCNSPKTLNDKNHQASSQKFRQLKSQKLLFCLRAPAGPHLGRQSIINKHSTRSSDLVKLWRASHLALVQGH